MAEAISRVVLQLVQVVLQLVEEYN